MRPLAEVVADLRNALTPSVTALDAWPGRHSDTADASVYEALDDAAMTLPRVRGLLAELSEIATTTTARDARSTKGDTP